MKRIVMLMAALAAVALPGSAQGQDFQVVVNESVPIETISKSDLSKVFQGPSPSRRSRTPPFSKGSYAELIRLPNP